MPIYPLLVETSSISSGCGFGILVDFLSLARLSLTELALTTTFFTSRVPSL